MRTKNTNGELFDYIPLTSPNLIGDTMATPRGLLYRKHSCFTTVFMDSSYLHANIASLIQLPSHRTLTEPQHFGFFADFIGTPTTPKNCHYTWCLPRKKRLNQFVKVCFSTLSNYIQYPAPSFSKKKVYIMIKSRTPCGHGHRPPSLFLPRGEFGFTNIQRERFGQAVLNRCGRIVHDLEPRISWDVDFRWEPSKPETQGMSREIVLGVL